MLTKHQTNVIDYFRDNAEMFSKLLFAAQSSEFQEYTKEDLMTRIKIFLDTNIRYELKVYDEKSDGYNRLVDMLIEINVPATDEFQTALTDGMKAVYLN